MSESAAEFAVHLAAAANHADAARLCDSASFMKTVQGLGPDTPGYVTRVEAAVRGAMQANPDYRRGDQPAAPQQPAALPASATPPRQWTLADVEAARTPQEVVDAVEAGLLRDLGYAPRRKRGARR